MLDFALKFNKNLRIKVQDFKNQFYHTSSSQKRKKKGLESKLVLALNMLRRAIKAGIQADYLLVDSWYSKPTFIKDVKRLKLHVITRIANNNKIWHFKNNYKTLNRIYAILIKTARRKRATYNKIKYTYCSTIINHHIAGRVKIVFIKTHNKLIPILSTNIRLTDEKIINANTISNSVNAFLFFHRFENHLQCISTYFSTSVGSLSYPSLTIYSSLHI